MGLVIPVVLLLPHQDGFFTKIISDQDADGYRISHPGEVRLVHADVELPLLPVDFHVLDVARAAFGTLILPLFAFLSPLV